MITLRPFTFLITFIFLFYPQFLYAKEPFISQIAIDKINKTVFFSSTLSWNMGDDMKKLIHSGTPATFSYEIKLRRQRVGWRDKTVGRMVVKRMVKYDLLNKSYKLSEKIERSGALIEEVQEASDEIKKENDFPDEVDTFDKVTSWMTDLKNIKLLNKERMDKDKNYYVKVRADLKSIKLWMPFNYILFFISFWDIDTDWKDSSLFMNQ
jgi:hypothetical protein